MRDCSWIPIPNRVGLKMCHRFLFDRFTMIWTKRCPKKFFLFFILFKQMSSLTNRIRIGWVIFARICVPFGTTYYKGWEKKIGWHEIKITLRMSITSSNMFLNLFKTLHHPKTYSCDCYTRKKGPVFLLMINH